MDLAPRRIMCRLELIGNSVASTKAGGRIALGCKWTEHPYVPPLHFFFCVGTSGCVTARRRSRMCYYRQMLCGEEPSTHL